jgi:alpha-galactosidase
MTRGPLIGVFAGLLLSFSVGPWDIESRGHDRINVRLREGQAVVRIGTMVLLRQRSGKAASVTPEKGGGIVINRDDLFTGVSVKTEITLTPLPGEFPTLRFDYTMTNRGKELLTIDSLQLASLEIAPEDFGAASATGFWSFQGSSTPERSDWILPLREGFAQRNYMGMNAPDYGGGIPLVDVWTARRGVALGSLAWEPPDLSLPVMASAAGAVTMQVRLDSHVRLRPGESASPDPVLLIAHRGDFFNPLRTYASIIRSRGAGVARFPACAYDVEWCGWGYERSFEPVQILQTLPLAKSVGAGWATVDDGWQDADGDWGLERRKFPRGEEDMRALVDSIHASGLRARIWWVPLEAHDSAYSATTFPGRMGEFGMAVQSRIARVRPDWFQLNEDGSRTQVSWWNSYTLCPALPEVREYYRSVVTRLVRDWGYDGLKIDGQNLNAVPPCYNRAHRHGSPWDAPRAVPEFFRGLYATATALKPDAVLELCPCGTTFAMQNLPYVNQPVASDPKNPWQVRLRAKAYKALLGGNVPYSGDHVELTNRLWDETERVSRVSGEEDFASTIGVGGVLSTKFTARGVTQADSSLALTPGKESRWRAWIATYNRERLSEGEYLNLYDIAFDLPETHVIRKQDRLYYALFARNRFSGTVSLRGLTAANYLVADYEHDRPLGEVTPGNPTLNVEFAGALLLKATPTINEKK